MEEMTAKREFKVDNSHVRRCMIKFVPLSWKTFRQHKRALIQIGSPNRLKLSEQDELMTRDEQAQESGGVVQWTAF